MKSILSGICSAVLFLTLTTAVHAQIPYTETRDLTAKQEAAAKRFLASQEFASPLDLSSMVAYQARPGQGKWEVWLSVSATPVLSPEGVCRSQRFQFSADAASEQWKTLQKKEWTVAWPWKNRACGLGGAGIQVGDSITDREFLTVERNQKTILDKSTSLIAGNTTCSEFIYCGLRLSGLHRVRDETSRKGAFALTYSPANTSQCSDWVQVQVTYEGPANELWPKAVNCPIPQ